MVELLSPAQACASLAISRPTLYRLMARGEISAIKIGRGTRIQSAEIERFVASRSSVQARTGLKAD
jgi:excisionase family DNA binding protein